MNHAPGYIIYKGARYVRATHVEIPIQGENITISTDDFVALRVKLRSGESITVEADDCVYVIHSENPGPAMKKMQMSKAVARLFGVPGCWIERRQK